MAYRNGMPETAAELNDGHPHGDARIESEVNRNPDQGDTRIARACRASLDSVRRVRERMGAYPTRPS